MRVLIELVIGCVTVAVRKPRTIDRSVCRFTRWMYRAHKSLSSVPRQRTAAVELPDRKLCIRVGRQSAAYLQRR